jgi:hypothetical protein
MISIEKQGFCNVRFLVADYEAAQTGETFDAAMALQPSVSRSLR